MDIVLARVSEDKKPIFVSVIHILRFRKSGFRPAGSRRKIQQRQASTSGDGDRRRDEPKERWVFLGASSGLGNRLPCLLSPRSR